MPTWSPCLPFWTKPLDPRISCLNGPKSTCEASPCVFLGSSLRGWTAPPMCIVQSPNGYRQSFKMRAKPSKVQDRAKGENKSGESQVPAVQTQNSEQSEFWMEMWTRWSFQRYFCLAFLLAWLKTFKRLPFLDQGLGKAYNLSFLKLSHTSQHNESLILVHLKDYH